jgi:DNA-binding CsgD family transcriptional regulator/tetratricopeptide (TPR) repeat protein
MSPLLERESELALLRETVAGAASGHGGLVLIGGEAGIGKTSLVRELRASAGPSVTFLIGGCEPLSVPVPLGPWREIADAAEAADPLDAGTADRLAVARALSETLVSRSPAVAVIEDAHWADPTTLDVLRLLVRRIEDAAIALVLTYREGEVAANADLARLLGDLATHPAVRRISLRPLSSGAVGVLARRAGLDPGQVVSLTGGNPFLVVEAIAAEGRLPASVRDAVLARASRLGPEARAAVEAAAVLGRRVDPAVLAEVVPGAGLAVEEALARGVLVAEGSALGFRHELIRDATEDLIPPARRLELHRMAVAALAQRPGGADNARLAHHAERGGMASEACSYAVLAAADAERAGALPEVRLQAERALRLGSELAADERLELLVRHARAANFTSTRLEDAVESAQEAVSLAAALGARVQEGRALVVLAWALWSLDRVAEARTAAERAVAVLERTDDAAERMRALATLVRMEATAFDPLTALEVGQPALRSARMSGLEDVGIDLSISIGLALGHRGDPEALEVLGRAREAAERAGLPIHTVRGYVNTAFVAALLRRHELVDATVTEALARFEEQGAAIPGNAVGLYRARSLLDRGRWDEALDIVTSPGRNWAAEAPVALALEGLIASRRGERPGDELLRRARREIEPVPESSRHGTIRSALIEHLWLQGEPAEARQLVHEGSGSPAASRFARSAAELALWARRLGVDADCPDGAPEPVLRELEGDWRAAVRSWRKLDAPYEAALAALPGDPPAAREAVGVLRTLGAQAAARAYARERAATGAPSARGPRRSTLANPGGLTRRQQEVLEQLATGATNTAIAAALHLSERTVAHHVSAILEKLGASSRLAAVEQARARGLLAQDGQRAAST